MRAVIQRVSEACVMINGREHVAIAAGFLILLGIGLEDNEEDAEWLCRKIFSLRVFADENGHMNKDILQISGDILVVSQFTLHASYRKGNRPSFTAAARPEHAIPLYTHFIKELTKLAGKPVATGTFGADMQVALINDGPVTILMDTKNKE